MNNRSAASLSPVSPTAPLIGSADSADPLAVPVAPKRRIPLLVEVLRVQRLNRGMIRIVFGGESLDGFAVGAFTDHYVKLMFPPAGADYSAPFDPEKIKADHPRESWPRLRTYTVRHWDAENLELTVDFVYHGDRGLAGPWAASAKPGDLIQLLGPGGAYTPDPGARWHLMVGDASTIPAISASLHRIAKGVPVHVLVKVHGADDELTDELQTPGDLHLQWLHYGHHPERDQLTEAVRALELPIGLGQAFVHGEAGEVRAVRRHLLVERGLEKSRLSASGYWKRNSTEEDWREFKPEWKRLVGTDA